MLKFRFSGGRFIRMGAPAEKQPANDRAREVVAAGLSEHAAEDAVEQVLLGEPDRAMLRLSITFPQKP